MEQEIFNAINAIMREIGVVGKGQTNTFSKYQYRGIDDVMNALNPALAKNGVFVTPQVLDMAREKRQGEKNMYTVLTIQFTFYAVKDGSSVSATVIGEAFDTGDKSANKAMAVAFKYAMVQVFCIPTEDMKDSDAFTPPPHPEYHCQACGAAFTDMNHAGRLYSAKEVYESCLNRSPDGVVRCINCRN